MVRRSPERELAESWGRALFEAQPEPVGWGARILDRIQWLAPGMSEVSDVLEVAEDSARWGDGHDVFNRARRTFLDETDRGRRITTRGAVLGFAELVAKIAYNASMPLSPFDANSGWHIGPVAYRIAIDQGDPRFRAAVRDAIGDWPVDAEASS